MTVCGPLMAEGAMIVKEQFFVLGVKLDVLTQALSRNGVTPIAAFKFSHSQPEPGFTENLTPLLGAPLVIVTVWVAGAALPRRYENDSVDGFTLIVVG